MFVPELGECLSELCRPQQTLNCLNILFLHIHTPCWKYMVKSSQKFNIFADQNLRSVADLGGGVGGMTLFFSGIRSTPSRPKGSPFVLFWDIHFWPTDLKIFLKARRAECAPKKRDFLVSIFQKVPKNAFFGLFSKICLRRRKLGQIWVFIVVSVSSQNQFGRPKKNDQQKINPPPLEKFLDPRLLAMV